MAERQRQRVLIVEDEALIAMELEAFLHDFGLDVVGMAHTGAAAIALARRERPDLLMMDIVIKGPIDGIETARRIREELDVPVVFLTAYGDQATLERAKSTEPYGYVLKPYRPDSLRAAVTVALYKHQLELQLKQSEQWFAKTLHFLTDGVISADASTRVRSMNAAAEALTGIAAGAAVGQPVSNVCRLREDVAGQPFSDIVAEALARDSPVPPRSALLERRGGGTVAVDASAALILDDEVRILGSVLVLRDITARRQMEADLRHSQERFHSAFNQAAVGMALVDTSGEILQANHAASSLLGFTEHELKGRTLSSLSYPSHVGLEQPLLTAIDSDERPAASLEKLFVHRNGDSLWVQMSVSAVRTARREPSYYIVQLQDVTDRKRAEAELEYLAHFDTLTGLRNRASFQLQLQASVDAAQRHASESAVMFIDLDGFKHVNDSLGHSAGDELLKMVASRLTSAVRASDVVGRLGGDEFVVLADGAAASKATRLALKILDVLSQPYRLGDRDIGVTASVGISVCPRDGLTADALLRNADTAMFHAKELGRNHFAFYDEELTRRAQERLQLESALRQALARDELRLVYQPIVEDGSVRTMEALLRWNHPDRGAISPAVFIPIAEETGLIVEIGGWVLRQACDQLSRWRAAGRALERVAINISVIQLLRTDFVSTVQAALDASALQGRDLEVEVTESMVMRDPERAVAALQSLRDGGVHVSIDDFGTGFSSLAQLQRLPVNRMKIDRSFVQRLPDDANAAAVVTTIAALGVALDLSVVAEGVETLQQQQFLLKRGVTSLQGYFFAHPMPPAEAASMLGARLQ